MRVSVITTVFQEVPDEISLAFEIIGCTIGCRGCHSPHLKIDGGGKELTEKMFRSYLKRYGQLVSCVLFMGGEWELDTLLLFLSIARKEFKLKTALYTGMDELPQFVFGYLDYVKIGPWCEDLGGLNSPITNQRFYKITQGVLEDKTEMFRRVYDSVH